MDPSFGTSMPAFHLIENCQGSPRCRIRGVHAPDEAFVCETCKGRQTRRATFNTLADLQAYVVNLPPW